MLSPLIEKFNQTSLPKSEWTHDAHLTVALWYLHTYEFDDAICRLKSGIILLNKFHGTENTDLSGYHETLTIFWTKVISIYIELNPLSSLKELSESLLKSAIADKELPFHFYLKRRNFESCFSGSISRADIGEIEWSGASKKNKLLTKQAPSELCV